MLSISDSDYKEATFINGTGMLNCSKQGQELHIERVYYNASICGSSNGSIVHHFSNLCNGKSLCEFDVFDAFNDVNLTCLRNETYAYLLNIYYYCTREYSYVN